MFWMILLVLFIMFLYVLYKKREKKEERLNIFMFKKELIKKIKIEDKIIKRAKELLLEKNVYLNEKQTEDLIIGFKDFLTIVSYNHYVLNKKISVPMTSDTVDMLWHAWLETPGYKNYFNNLLGFDLNHKPEKDLEKISKLRGKNGLLSLQNNPTDNAAKTYLLFNKALMTNSKTADKSPLYNLDREVNNKEGFFYTPMILSALMIASQKTKYENSLNSSGSSCTSCSSCSSNSSCSSCSSCGD